MIRTRVQLGAPPSDGLRLRRRARFLSAFALSVGLVSALHAAWYALKPLGELTPMGIIGLAIGGGGLLLSLPIAWKRPNLGLYVLAVFPFVEAAIFVLVANAAPLPLTDRWLVVGGAAVTLGVLALLVGVLKPELGERSVLLAAGAIALGAVALEVLAALVLAVWPSPLPLDAAEPTAVLGFAEFVDQLEGIGPVPIPRSETESVYAGNPRGYFREEVPDWVLWTQPSHRADLDVTSERAAVYIHQADDTASWNIQLSRFGVSVVGGTDYALRLRVRASDPRPYYLAVSMAHEPWETLGFWTTGMIGREWTSVERIFTARTSEDSARIQVNLGGDTADVFVADVEMEQVGPTPVSAGPEHRVVYSWNSRGCRARDYPIPEESGAFRILALGDSYTAGVGVYAEDLFTAAMEQALNEGGGGRGFEVINCGVSGFGTREQALYYQQRLSDYEPDLVLVVMTANDDRSFGEDVRMGYVHRPTRWESIFDLVGALQTFRHRRPQPDFSDAMGELAALHELLREEGTEMGVVLFTNTTNRAWDLLAEHAGSAAAALDVPLLDLREALSSMSSADLMVHPSDGHPNEIAHRIAGETIVGWLEREDLLEEN